MRGYAKHIAHSCKHKAKVTVEGNGIEMNLMSTLYLILVEYLSKLDDVRSVLFDHDHKVAVTSGDHKFEPLILCPHPIAFTLKLFNKI